MLYSQFDDNKLKTGKIGLEPLAHMFGYKPQAKKGQKKLLVPSNIVDLVGKSIHWVDYRGMRLKAENPSNHRIIGIIRDREDFVQFLIAIHSDPSNPFDKDEDKLSSSWFWRQGVVAAVYKTWSVNKDLATSFWTRVLRPIESGDPEGHPEFLRNLLRNGRKGGDWGRKTQSRILKACEIAWNAWRQEGDQAKQPPAGLTLSAIASLDDNSLENLHFQDISMGHDAIDLEIEKGHGEVIIKTGKLVD
jgi:hypothetical protein